MTEKSTGRASEEIMRQTSTIVGELRRAWLQHKSKAGGTQAFLLRLQDIQGQLSTAYSNDTHALGSVVKQAVGSECRPSDVVSVLEAVRGVRTLPFAINSVRGLLAGFQVIVREKGEGEPTLEETDAVKAALHQLLLHHEVDAATTSAARNIVSDLFRLTWQSFHTFPSLRKMKVHMDVLRRLQDQLLSGGHYGPAVRLYTIYSTQVDDADIQNLVSSLYEAEQWDKLVIVFQAAASASDHPSSSSILNDDEPVCNDADEVDALIELEVLSVSGEDDPPLTGEGERRRNLASLAEATARKMLSKEEQNTTSLKAALSIANIFKISQLRGEIKVALTKHRVHQFAAKGKWHLASQICETACLQVELFHLLTRLGMFSEAACIFDQFNLEAQGVAPVSPDNVAQQDAEEKARYLQLPASVKVVTVDSLSSVADAAEILGFETLPQGGFAARRRSDAVQFVAVDSEWPASVRPSEQQNEQGATLLQIATADHVLLFDFVALQMADAETQRDGVNLLTALFHSPTVVKVGWSFNQSDLTMLRRSGRDKQFVGVFARERISSVLELNRMLIAMYGSGQKLRVRDLINERQGKSMALSDACLKFLGRPLAKFEQTSNWEERPLRQRQRVYAALDAHCLLGLLNIMLRDCPHGPILSPAYYPEALQLSPLSAGSKAPLETFLSTIMTA